MNIAELHDKGTSFITRGHRPVRILCTNRRGPDDMVVVGLITCRATGTELIETWTLSGEAMIDRDNDLVPAQVLAKGPAHWAQENPGAADQYRCEARAARSALGFGKDDPHVAPVDLRKAIEDLKAGDSGSSLTLRKVLHERPNPNDRDLRSEYTRWLNQCVEPAVRSSRDAAHKAETRLRQEGYTAAMVVALTHVKPESDEYWGLVRTVGGMNRLWDAAGQLGADIYDFEILPATDNGGAANA